MSDRKPDGYGRTRKLALLSVFLSFALIIGIIERSIPFDFAIPGVKLGLGNVVILSALYLFGIPEAFVLAVLKTVLISIFAGSFTTFVYSFSGALLSFFAMAVTLIISGKKLSPIGVSIIGATFHNLGQVISVCFVMETFLIITYFPVLLVSGIVTGILIGIAVKYILRYITAFWDKKKY